MNIMIEKARPEDIGGLDWFYLYEKSICGKAEDFLNGEI